MRSSSGSCMWAQSVYQSDDISREWIEVFFIIFCQIVTRVCLYGQPRASTRFKHDWASATLVQHLPSRPTAVPIWAVLVGSVLLAICIGHMRRAGVQMR